MNLTLLKKLAAAGESADVEFKKSTADLHGACESLCGMLNAGLDARVIIGIAANRLPVSARGTVEEILTKFELANGTQLTNAAIVLFGKSNAHLPLQCTLMLARFKGTDKGEFLDHKQIVGNAFELLDEGMMFLSRHLPLRGRFEKNNIQRIDEPLIPTEALREALVNAICHRDYEHPGSSIHLAIYDDRVEIVSSGGLMSGIQISDLKKPHKSILRNPYYRTNFLLCWLCRKVGARNLKNG